MISNPMYQTSADYSKRYCIDSSSIDGTDFAPYAMGFANGILDILLLKSHFSKDLPPFDTLTCRSYSIQGTLKGDGLDEMGDPLPVSFILQATSKGECTMDLMYETAYGAKSHGRAVVSVEPGMFSIDVLPDESDPEMDAILIRAVPPWEKIDNVETFHLADGIRTLGDSSPYMMLRSIMLSVKCAKEG